MNFNVTIQIIILIATFGCEFSDVLNSQFETSFRNLTVSNAIRLILIVVLSSIYKSIPLLLAVNFVCNVPTYIN